MGRRRRQRYFTQYGLAEINSKDKGDPGTTEASLGEFAENSNGPVSAQLWERGLIGYDSEGNVKVRKEAVRAEVEAIKAEVISAREYPKEQLYQQAADATGLPAKQAINAEGRTMQARVKAVYAAAKAGGVTISPSDKRVLNSLEQGRYVETIYGKQGRFESGTLATRFKATRKARSKDPGAQARAREMRDTLREYRYERFVA